MPCPVQIIISLDWTMIIFLQAHSRVIYYHCVKLLHHQWIRLREVIQVVLTRNIDVQTVIPLYPSKLYFQEV